MKEIIKAYNRIIAECNDGKSVAFTNCIIRENRIEDYRNHQCHLNKVCLSAMKSTILNESIFRNADLLINDIMQRLENEEYEFTYSKNELLKLMKGFNYEEKFKNEVPDRFKLSVICISRNDFHERFGIKLTEDSIVEEVLNPNDEWHEMIVIPIGKYRHRYAIIKEYLKEELRHVWTYVLGMVDDNFYVGRTSFSSEDHLDAGRFNSYQRQVLKEMYFGDLNLLQKDYDNIFKIQDGNAENWELSVHIDAMIDMLIDYYDGTCLTEEYLKEILDNVRTNSYDSGNRLLHDFYENDSQDFKPTKDNIRRLFMLYAFGNSEQIEYFENECEKEFGKMK